VGDHIWVSHQVGDARLALGAIRHEWSLTESEMKSVSQRMHNPSPRVELGQALLDVAHSAIDVSDGLLGDLTHILSQSNVCAEVAIDEVPASDVLKSKSIELRRLCTLMGGDDYELCFTAPAENAEQIEKISAQLNIRLTRIGKITSSKTTKDTSGNLAGVLRLLDHEGHELPPELSSQYLKSFDHFK
jgi:thiamine-monophosphate kinase